MCVCVCVCACVCVLCVYPSDGIHVVACGPIGTKFGDSSPNGSELNKNQLCGTQGGLGGGGF